MTVRSNLLVETRAGLAAELKNAGLQTTLGTWCDTALIVETRANLFATNAFIRGAMEAQDEGNFFWVESEKPVQVTITGSNGGAPQVCTSNGFIVWYGALAGVLITQMDASENTVTLAWA